MTRGLNEDKLKSMKKGPRTRTLKSTKTWKLHQMIPTKDLQNVSKHEMHKKVKMMTRFGGIVEDRSKKRGRSNDLVSGSTVVLRFVYGRGIR